MPTYAQLQAESWWGREIITAEMTWLGAELCRRTGRPADAFGTKGDLAHLYGAHRSQEWILNSRWCTSRTYTVQPGLTDLQKRYVAGGDFTPGNVEQMIAESQRLMAAMKVGRLDEVTEIYCNVDGDQVVDGWDNVRDRAITSDSSHLWHWHLTFDRRHCANRSLMERVVAIALGDPVEDDMTPDQDKKLSDIHYTLTHLGQGGGVGALHAVYPALAADAKAARAAAESANGKAGTAQPAGQPTQEQVNTAVLAAMLDPRVQHGIGDAIASHLHVS